MNRNLTLALCVAAVTVMMPIRPTWAQGGPAEAVAAGAAVATAVMTAIGGLSAWINDQSDDVAAAVLAAAFGKHGLTQEEEKDTGYYWALVSARADDQHGKGSADASASESAFGAWAGSEIAPVASAKTKALHTPPDDHHAKGFATASVDGYVKSTTRQSDRTAALAGPSALGAGVSEAWDYTPLAGVPGDVWLTVAIPTDSFMLQAGNGGGNGSAATSWQYSVQVDGVDRFFTELMFDHTGALSITSRDGVARMNPGLFTTSLVGGVAALLLTPNALIGGVPYYVSDILIDHLSMPDAAGGLGEEIQYAFSASADMSAAADVAADPVPEPGSLALFGTGLLFLGHRMRRRARQHQLDSATAQV